MKRFELGHKGWFKVDLSDNLIDFSITTDPYVSEHMDFSVASDYTAQLIADRYDSIYVAYSGGLDSEYVMKVLQRNRISFTPICFINPFCTAESEYARYYCKKNDLDPIWITASSSGVLGAATAIAKKYNIKCFPAGITPFAIDSKLQNSIILTGESHPINYPETEPFSFVTYEFLPNYFEKNTWVSFFNYTIEIFRACVSEVDVTLSTQEAKSKLYGLPFRPKIVTNDLFRCVLKDPNRLYKLIDMYSSMPDYILKIVSNQDIEQMLTKGKTI